MAKQRFPVLQPVPVMCCTMGLTKGSRRLPAVMKPDSFFLSAASSLDSAGASADAGSAGLAVAVLVSGFASCFLATGAVGAAGFGLVFGAMVFWAVTFGATVFANGSCLAGTAAFVVGAACVAGAAFAAAGPAATAGLAVATEGLEAAGLTGDFCVATKTGLADAGAALGLAAVAAAGLPAGTLAAALPFRAASLAAFFCCCMLFI